MLPHPVIGLMVKAPRPGLAKTRLIPALGAAGAAALAQAFIADSAVLLRGSGADAVVLATPAEATPALSAVTGLPALVQRDGDLGARMHGAFADLFARGGSPVLLIGADAPTLPPQHLGAALSLAVTNPEAVVLGPAEDGGYWCIALTRPQPCLFSSIAWGTASVLAETQARARRFGIPVVLAPRWHDVDQPADLDQLRRDLARDPWAAPHTRAVLASDALPIPA
jgi:rSAM/selenodomain-associated transferase 1